MRFPCQQAELAHDLTELLLQFNRSGDESLMVESEYVEVVATKR